MTFLTIFPLVLDPTYGDVSGLPDPYSPNPEQQLISVGNGDAGLTNGASGGPNESGYSTPTSRNRRIIREIIV